MIEKIAGLCAQAGIILAIGKLIGLISWKWWIIAAIGLTPIWGVLVLFLGYIIIDILF